MRIGELSARAGVNVQTIRFYEREKLLRKPVRTASGYRTFEEGDLERVRSEARIFDWTGAALVAAFAMVMNLVFTLLPSRRAARLDPIRALKSE